VMCRDRPPTADPQCKQEDGWQRQWISHTDRLVRFCGLKNEEGERATGSGGARRWACSRESSTRFRKGPPSVALAMHTCSPGEESAIPGSWR